MNLPYNPEISISKLSSVFKNTSATYKFYWFWSILQAVENGNNTISKKEIFSRMLTLAWYTVNYFHISFGKQDLIQDAILKIKELEVINIDEKQNIILNKLINSTNSETNKILNHFDKNVPHKFLSPWLGAESKSKMYELSLDINYNTPYSLFSDYIVISNKWASYLKKNIAVLKAFCFWNLTLFLQTRNPNVPDIPNKIHRPIIRNSLNNHKIKFWDYVLDELGSLNCIYTGKKLIKGGYIIEHFIPYQFVAHDLMWNLIPADSTFNSKKSDKLPRFDIYFDLFYNTQKIGVDIIKKVKPKNHYLQDYLPIFPDLEINKYRFEEHIKPMLTIAHNNGFQYLDI
ncbi:MAG: HNH endonuclease domain-containing protein [Gelidibacter sp.]